MNAVSAMNSIRDIPLSAEVTALLAANHLPIEDIQNGRAVSLFGSFSAGALCGVIGLELHGQNALLRSLAVSPTRRRFGTGSALVSFAECEAVKHGVTAVYLLTSTAAQFFEHRGYFYVQRLEAPASIASTSQFSNLCPASAAFMVKAVQG
jgi:amino-acid N-acetyltransferase